MKQHRTTSWIFMGSWIVSCGLLAIGDWFHWPWYATMLACAGVLGFAALESYERSASDAKMVALIATLSAVASVGRAAMQGIPSVQPATFLVMMAGFSLGPRVGAAVGVLTALGSDLFLGEGAWTPWQMVAWGLVGFTSGWLRFWLRDFRLIALLMFGAVWGYAFGWLMNTWLLLGGGPVSWAAYLTLCAQSFYPFDTNHALANVVFTLVAGKIVFRELERFRRRFTSAHVSPTPVDSNQPEHKGGEPT